MKGLTLSQFVFQACTGFSISFSRGPEELKMVESIQGMLTEGGEDSEQRI